ncbi:MAG TPA: diguanylate cyclase [Candidatus Sulfotelmatobacter sp.]|nr:diguanylate cyclase [Candidatus Sulfotelmatobacter sp.]
MGPATESGPDGSHSESSRRAYLTRTVAHVLAADVPLDELWSRCAVPLALLADARRVVVILSDGDDERVVHDSTPDEPADPGALVVPIRFAMQTLGTLRFEGVRDPANPVLVSLLDSCALFVGARLHHEGTLRNTRRYAELAFTDALTGLANRRRFDEALALEWTRALRERSPLTVLIADLDHFKAYNDTYGHAAGDLCLRQVGGRLGACVQRPADLAARYGGEEFVALLPDTDLKGGIALGERLRTELASLTLVHAGSSLGRVSASIGVASIVPDSSIGAEQLLRRADEALYRAKRGGRDRVVAGTYVSDAAGARRERTAVPNNLPIELTRMIGRRSEIAAVRTLVEDRRLVTVVGAGGTGKTRVALHAATELAERFTDGAWFVDLAPLADPALVGTTIGEVFGIPLAPDPSAIPTLVEALAGRRALLVLDNCEHLIGAAADAAAALLRGRPEIAILATSREPLGIAGETLYRLPPLDAHDAAELFVDRARAATPSFTLSAGDDALVEDICRRLDGIALAIELAASQVGVLGLAAMAERLRARFRFLTGGDRSALPRHQTVRALFDWSYDLLAPAEAAVLRRLSVFAGGFDLEAACAVCEDDVADTLTALVRKSLVEDIGLAQRRYRLLESTREYAREQLLASGERDQTARRHANAVLDVARAGAAIYRTTPADAWIAARRPDLDNYREALEWSLGEGNEPVLGAQIATALRSFFDDVAPAEGAQWYERALVALGEGEPALQAQLLMALHSGRRDRPATTIRASLERAVAICRELGDDALLAEATRMLAQIIGWYFRAERELADAYAQESIALARKLGDPYQLAVSLRTRGLTIDIADFPAKRAALEEAIVLLERLGNMRMVGSALTWLSEMEFSAGDEARALTLGREALRAAEQTGSTALDMNASSNLALYAAAQGDWELARRMAERALQRAREARDPEHLTWSVQALAIIAAGRYDPGRAARLLGFCATRAGIVHAPRQADQSEDLTYRRLAQRLCETLGEDGYRFELAIGGQYGEDEAIAEGLAG